MNADEILQALAALDDVEESPSAFKEGRALWVNGKEIAHLDGMDRLDLRLGRTLIRQLRPELRANWRVSLRSSSSDWIEVALDGDVDPWLQELFSQAVLAHRAAPGTVPKPPPTGQALERRRRFH